MSVIAAEPATFLLTEQQFAHLAALVKQHFGIFLTDEKRVMLSMRMQKMMRASKYTSFDSYFGEQLRQPSKEVLRELVNHVSTNHTHFWREPEHFELYREEVLPAALARRERRRQSDLRVWCAASSTGEEPYTLAALQREVMGARYSSWRAGLLATDISTRALDEARQGTYAADAVSRLPASLQRYFEPSGPGRVTARPELKADVLFRRLNLVQPMPLRGDLDVIFCRNVMIYFDEPTKKGVVEQMYRLLAPGGVLFIGHAETLNKLGTPLSFWRPGVYRKV